MIKIRLNEVVAKSLISIIDLIITAEQFETNSEKLFLAAINQFNIRLKKSTIEYRQFYSLKLDAVQAVAVHILYTEYVAYYQDSHTYLTNSLMKISNEIHQKIV